MDQAQYGVFAASGAGPALGAPGVAQRPRGIAVCVLVEVLLAVDLWVTRDA